MKKGNKFMLNGLAALATCFVAVGCSNDNYYTEQDALSNANKVLGIEIPSNQTWKMTQEVAANVTVNLDKGGEYTVVVFDKSPFDHSDAAYFSKKIVSDGTVTKFDLSVPSYLTQLYFSVIDSDGASRSKEMFITDNEVNVVFGTAMEGSFGKTRANNPGADYPATSTGINANANEWADYTQGKEFGGWIVPDPLTAEQKAVVKAYFQAVPNLKYEDPHWRHFFVQQVYKGATDAGVNSTEINLAANGVEYTSDNMNLMTVGYNEQHINNFNAGSYSGTNVNNYAGAINQDGTVNVLDSNYTANDFADHHHPDQIMLMVNIDDTECFGYHNTGCSLQKNDKAALVGWQTIRTWANGNGLNGDCLKDGWNRSFLGYDFELYSREESYAKNGNDKIYARFNDGQLSQVQYVWDGEQVMKRSSNYSRAKRGKGKKAGVSINGEYYYKVKEGDNPADGESVFITHDGEPIAKITFYGTEGAAEASTAMGGYEAKLSRSYIIFMPLVSGNSGQATFCHDSRASQNVKLMLRDLDDNNKYYIGEWGPTWQSEVYTGGLVGGHRYKLEFEDGQPVTIYGIKYYNMGTSIDDPEGSTPGGGDNPGGGDTPGGGDNPGGQGEGDGYVIYDSEYIVIDGNMIPFLSEKDNMYGGLVRTLTDDEMKTTQDGKECVNLLVFKGLVDDGYLPRKDTNLRTWYKWQGGDGYFSDWIVTLTRADRLDNEEVHVEEPQMAPVIYSYAFEDSWIADYDMNDVVLKVKEYEQNPDYLEVTLCCTGASYDLTVYMHYKDERGNDVNEKIFGGQEVHVVLGSTAGIFVNTGEGENHEYRSPQTVKVKKPADFNGIVDLWIKSPERNVHVSKEMDPHGVLIPYDWRWPKERICIKDAYPDFINFARYPDNPAYAEWYKNAIEENLY